jgi:hypothetical protein
MCVKKFKNNHLTLFASYFILYILLSALILFLSCERDISGINKNNGTSPGPDTTSHNFVWTIDTIGTFGSTLYDVFAIAEDDVWAVGEIHTAETDTFDSLGNWVQPYNAIHWDGNSWDTNRITVRLDYGSGNVRYTDSDILKTVFGLNKSDFWFVSSAGGVTRFNDNQWTYLEIPYGSGLGGANEIWGNVSNNMYFVSSNGLITYYNGLIWQKMESGTDLRLTDIWGLSENDIYAVGADMSSRDNVVLHYDGTSWKKLPTDLNRKVGVWGTAPDNLYFVGDGIFRLEGDSLRKLEPLVNVPKYFMEKVRGTAANNMFIVGHFGFVVHYNGSTWKYYPELYRYAIASSVTVKGNSVFVVGIDGSQAFIYRGRRMD